LIPKAVPTKSDPQKRCLNPIRLRDRRCRNRVPIPRCVAAVAWLSSGDELTLARAGVGCELGQGVDGACVRRDAHRFVSGCLFWDEDQLEW